MIKIADIMNISTAYTMFNTIMQIIIPIAVVGLIGFLVLKFDILTPHPIDVTILFPNGRIKRDKMRIKKDKKRKVITGSILKSDKSASMPTIKYSSFSVNDKGKKHIFLFSPEAGVYSVYNAKMKLGKLELEKTGSEGLMRRQKALDDQEADIKWQEKKDWKQQMIPIATLSICIVLLVVFLWGYSEYVLKPVTGTLNNAIGSAVQLTQKNQEMLDKSIQYLEMTGCIQPQGNTTVI